MTRQDLIWIAAWGMWALAGTLDAQGAEPSAGPKAIASPFFAMDTALRDGVNRTPQEQARLLKELGYAGLGGGPAGIEQSLAALDHEGLKLFTVYLGINLEQPDYTQIEKAAAALRGRDTIVWLTLTSTRYKPSSIEGDTQAVAILQKVAVVAQANGLRIALYPHTGFWMERTQDAVRLVKKAARANLGVTFNLCHCLRVGDEPRIGQILKEAMPYLIVVSIHGADHEGDWDRLIQTLDRGTFDVAALLKQLVKLGYKGPIGFQGYGIRGPAPENLRRTMEAWHKLSLRAAE